MMKWDSSTNTRATEILVASNIARTAALALAAKLDAAKLRTLKLERARLLAKYGKGSNQLGELEARFDSQRTASSDLRAEVLHARSPLPAVDADRFGVQGRVTERGSPRAQLTVSAVDRHGRELGCSDTDSIGFYRITLDPKDQGQTGLLKVEGATERPARAVLVVLEGGKAIFKDETQIDVTPGEVALRDLEISDGLRGAGGAYRGRSSG
jgi:hypothetical protein